MTIEFYVHLQFETVKCFNQTDNDNRPQQIIGIISRPPSSGPLSSAFAQRRTDQMRTASSNGSTRVFLNCVCLCVQVCLTFVGRFRQTARAEERLNFIFRTRFNEFNDRAY